MHRQASRKYKRLFFTCFATFSLVYSIALTWATYTEATALTTTARVTHEKSHLKRLSYTVELTTADGNLCRAAILRSSVPGTASVGDTITVRHPQHGQQCINVKGELDPGGAKWALAMGLSFMTVGLIGSYIAWRRTDPDGQIRWQR